jgi:hypothetical protein
LRGHGVNEGCTLIDVISNCGLRGSDDDSILTDGYSAALLATFGTEQYAIARIMPAILRR